MTRDISRRRLVMGTAWAAPAILASSVVPAYASSVEQCTHFDELRTFIPFYRPTRTQIIKDLPIPPGVTAVKFSISGGAGGTSFPKYPQASTAYGTNGGMGARVSGIVNVKAGQVLRFHIGASGEGNFSRPATGGEGYGTGGSVTATPASTIADGDKATMTNPAFNHVSAYSASGGGSSALLLIDPATGSEQLLAIAGAGGGNGVRIMAVEDNSPSHNVGWSLFTLTVGKGGTGGTGDIDHQSAGGNSVEYYPEYNDASITVYGGAPGVYGAAGAGGHRATLDTSSGLTHSSTGASTIRTSNMAGAAGGDGERGHGADGVPAYGYAVSTHPQDISPGSTAAFNVTAFIVSGGGGAGYGGGGSGAALAVGTQATDREYEPAQRTGNFYAVSAGVTAGGGGAGGCYVSNAVIEPMISTINDHHPIGGEQVHGEAKYAFCTA